MELQREPSLAAGTRPETKKGQPNAPDYTAATAEAAVKQGVAPAALIIPKGFGANPVAFGPGTDRQPIRILHDSSDPVAAQVVAGLLQKVVMTSLPDAMAGVGMKYFDQASGGLTPRQRQDIESNLSKFHDHIEQRDQTANAPAADSGNNAGGLVAIDMRDVVGENKRSPMIAFSAAGIGVMFLLFTASASAGSLLNEAECGAAVFHLELFTHLPGFLLMTAATSFAVASFGMLLATVSRTRGQQAAISTLLILTMSAIGGSMFPRFLMPEAMKTAGLFTFNAWAIDGYTKVFWRDEPISHLAPQVAVLMGSGMVLFLIARRFARKWEYQ